MTLIRPLFLFTQTNVRWKRLFCTIEPASAVELTTRIATPAAAIQHAFFAFIVYPFPTAARPADGVDCRAQIPFSRVARGSASGERITPLRLGPATRRSRPRADLSQGCRRPGPPPRKRLS